MKRAVALALAALALTACTPAPTGPESAPTVYPTRFRTGTSAPTSGEIDCSAIQTTDADSPAFGLLLLALASSPDAGVAAAAHNVIVAHAATFDDPSTAPLVEIPLATLRVRCQLAYPGV